MALIEWTDETWNPIRGCSLVSAGCANCYAMKFAHRFSGAGKPYDGLTDLGPRGPRWTGKIRLVPEVLEQPLHWKKPRRIFVNSMSDLFHESVSDDFLFRVFRIMARCQQHTFQILTKRPARMQNFCRRISYIQPGFNDHPFGMCSYWPNDPEKYPIETRPLPNVWLGVSVEDQKTADERIPTLLQTPAAVRFVSCEPLLGPVHVQHWIAQAEGSRNIDWVIVGGESGPGARSCDIAWIRSIKDQCQAAKVPVFVKQVGARWYDEAARVGIRGSCAVPVDSPWTWITQRDAKGGDWTDSEFPEDLKVREWKQ